MRVLRSSLFVAATAIIAAACGDKINLPSTPTGGTTTTTTAKINSVLVAPSSATISAGQDVQLTAVVDADAGITATVVWSTTSSASATVSQTGLVHGVLASPGVAICATASATGVASKGNCATIVVQPPNVTVPAVLQIASVTVNGNLNNPVPTPPGVMGGQVNVSVNLSPGTEKMDSVVVLLNGKPVATQTFTSAQAAALRSAANVAGSDQALQSTLVFPVNTAAYNATTGAVTFVNTAPGATIAFQVIGYGKQGSTPGINTVTSQGYALFNADAWVLTQTIGTTKVANDINGFAHTTGSVAVSAVPVLYSGLAIATASVNFGSAACDDSGIGQRAHALALPATGTFAWTATFADTSQTTTSNTTASGNRGTVNSYEFSPVLCAAANAAGGEGAVIAASQYTTTGNSGPAGLGAFALGTAAPLVRLDNRAPMSATALGSATNGAQAIPGLSLSCPFCLGGRTGNWINDGVTITGTSSTAGNAIFRSGTGTDGMLGDGGVGGIVVTASVTGGALSAPTSLTNATTLAESAAGNTYTATYTFADALGNTTVAAAATPQIVTFGVDRTKPVLTLAASPTNDSSYAADPAIGFAFAATDNATGSAAPSGFFNLGLTPLTMSEAARNSVGTTWWCPASGNFQKTLAAGGVCATWTQTGANQNFAVNLNSPDHGIANAYFTTTATVTDQAGNTSDPATNLFAVDAVTPVMGGIAFPPFFTAGGAATFTSVSTTLGLDIATSRMNLGYGAPGLGLFDGNTGAAFAPSSAAGGARLWQPDVPVDAFNAATLQTSAPFTVTVNPVLTNVQGATAAAGTNGAVAGVSLTSVNAFSLNQPGTASAVSTSAITAASIPPSTPITNTGLAGAGPVNFLMCGVGAACASPPAALAAGTFIISRTGVASNPVSVVLTAVAEGTTAVFNNPFSSVQFWVYDPCTGLNAPQLGCLRNTEGWRLIATVTNSSTVTDGGLAVPSGRNWQFSTTWTPSLTTAASNVVYKVMAIGIGGTNLPVAQQGMALATPLGGITVTVIP
jgi:hypothetical protein